MAALVPFFLVSCKKEPEKQPEPLKRAAPAVKAPASQAQTQAQDAEVKKEEEPAVEVKQRNPFQSHFMAAKPAEAVAKRPKRPLECCEAASFRLLAVMAGFDFPAALVQAPDGKRYIIKKGDIIGPREGKVVKITDRSVIVRELITSTDEEAKVTATDTEIKLPAEKGYSEFSN